MVSMSDYQESVELYFSGRTLKNEDFIGKSDPKVKAYMQVRGQWIGIGETETIQDNLNPDFKTTVKADFVFETRQPVRFEVFDVDKYKSDDLIGTAESTLGEIMGARKQTVTLQLINDQSKSTGKLIVRGDKTGASRNLVFWQWSGLNLMNVAGCFGKSSPFLRFCKEKAGSWLPVHECEPAVKNLNPVWQTFQIGDDKLCGADHTKPIRVECMDYKANGNHKLIGYADITLERLKGGETSFPLVNPNKGKNTGMLKLSNYSTQALPSFVDYIRGGEQLNNIIAIDFTGSNGDPRNPNSLHARFKDGKLNEYQQAITSVCQIIMNYDYDQMAPVFGFGGKPHYETGLNSMQVSHCFPCSGNIAQSQVLGLQGILDVYNYALERVDLSGPTLFAPIIGEAVKVCEINKQNETDIYTILMIMTDGEIHDMDDTIDLIVGAAHLPLSIIIVGVGSEDFKSMEILDGDRGLVNSKGQKCARDFVQFVPFRNYKSDMMMLAKQVLAEVPGQLVEYKRLVNKKPKPPLF